MSEGQHNGLAANASLGAGDSLWQACIDQLAQELPEQQFNTWIKPLAARVSDDFSKVTVFVANRFKLDWVRAQYSNRIAGLLEKLYGQPVQLELALAPRENYTKAYSTPASTEMRLAPEPADIIEENAAAAFKNRLNTALTFDTLVEGSANRMASYRCSISTVRKSTRRSCATVSIRLGRRYGSTTHSSLIGSSVSSPRRDGGSPRRRSELGEKRGGEQKRRH